MVWCHFPTVADFLSSLSGVRNLVRDDDPARVICTDDSLDKHGQYTGGKSNTFKCIDNVNPELPPDRVNLLSCPVDAIIAQSNVMSPDNFVAAAGEGDEATIKFLITRRMDVNTRDDSQQTALQRSLFSGHMDTVELLLAAGARADGFGVGDGSLLHAAVRKGFVKTLPRLILARADVESKDADLTALHLASKLGDGPAVAALMSASADIEALRR